MNGNYELVFNKDECEEKSDLRGRKRSKRVEEIADIYKSAIANKAKAVKIAMVDELEHNKWHTFRYRLISAAKIVGIDVRVSINIKDECAMVTFVGGSDD